LYVPQLTNTIYTVGPPTNGRPPLTGGYGLPRHGTDTEGQTPRQKKFASSDSLSFRRKCYS